MDMMKTNLLSWLRAFLLSLFIIALWNLVGVYLFNNLVDIGWLKWLFNSWLLLLLAIPLTPLIRRFINKKLSEEQKLGKRGKNNFYGRESKEIKHKTMECLQLH